MRATADFLDAVAAGDGAAACAVLAPDTIAEIEKPSFPDGWRVVAAGCRWPA
jgi:hypothetical protein